MTCLNPLNIAKILSVFLIILPLYSTASDEYEKVSVQLNWKYQFEFAGYIAAKEKGFYRDVGLDVELIEYHNDIDILNNVLEQKSNFGISDFTVFTRDKKIVPVKLLATYIQHSPIVLLTSKDIKSPHDLLGKTVMVPKLQLENSSVALLLAHFYLNENNTRFIEPSFNMDDFIAQKADAIFAYTSNEPFELSQKGAEFNVINPEDYGYISPTGNLFTSPKEANDHPERTQKFINASTKGWEYALTHQEEIIALILEKYASEKSAEALRFEANEFKKLISPDTIALGTINQQARLNFVRQLKRSNLLSENETLNDLENKSSFSPEQLRYLKTKAQITMCVDPNWMPFEAIKNGKHIGISADIFKQLQQHLPIPITLVATDNWHDSINKAKRRECDILSLASDTPERSSFMNFTSPYVDLPVVLVTKMNTFFINDIAEVKHKKLGIVKGYAVAEQLRNKFPDINIIDVASIDDGLARVESGELFAYIDNLMVVADSIQKHFTGELKVSSRLDESVKLAIGTRNDEPQLNEIFDILINNLNSSEVQSIYNKWVAVAQDPIIDYGILWKTILTLLIVSLAYLLHYLKLKKLNSQLKVLSMTDTLTGLHNRLKIDTVIASKKAELDRYHHPLSIILMDIDHFKDINDKYGHIVGDKTLIAFSNILKSNVRSTDFVSRWGGEEFLIVCPNINGKNAEELAKKLLNKIREHDFEEVEHLTASAGVYELSTDIDIETSLKEVDQALYKAKNHGRDRVSFL